MKRVVFILLGLCFAAFAQEVGTNIAGGLSLMTGDRADNMNPGISASIEPNGRINRFVGLGGHVDYSWLSQKTDFDNVKAGYHLIDVGFVPKFYAPLGGFNSMFFEVDPAILFQIYYNRIEDNSDNSFDPYFALTYGAGFEFSNLILGVKFKSAFTERENTNWLNFYVGFVAR